LFGRGVGTFPIDEGAGAPDWLLHKTEGAKHFPHNVHLEVLYESGISALLAFCFLTVFPLVYAANYWARFGVAERAAISLYVFYLTSVEISGSFAYGNDLQFFRPCGWRRKH
jgi:O-antigen ligase